MSTAEALMHQEILAANDRLVDRLPVSSKRAVMSTQIYFDELLRHVEKTAGELQDDETLQTLVTLFGEMARRYHLAVSQSLEEALLAKQRAFAVLKDDVQKLVEPDELRGEMAAGRQVLVAAAAGRWEAYEALLREAPIVLQESLEKLTREWDRIAKIVAAAQTLEPELRRALRRVVLVAAAAVGVPAENILIVPGEVPALTFFHYIENFAVLTLPLYSLQAPWEWSIIWHELAGYKVRRLNAEEGRLEIQDSMKEFFLFGGLMGPSDLEEEDFAQAQYSNNPEFLLDLTRKLSSLFQQVLAEMFPRLTDDERETLFATLQSILSNAEALSLESQFQAIMGRLVEKFPFTAVQEQGWTRDWIEELFEDAWSVLTFHDPFIEIFFGDTLGHQRSLDEIRHPPLAIRRQVAAEMNRLGSPRRIQVVELGRLSRPERRTIEITAENGAAFAEGDYLALSGGGVEWIDEMLKDSNEPLPWHPTGTNGRKQSRPLVLRIPLAQLQTGENRARLVVQLRQSPQAPDALFWRVHNAEGAVVSSTGVLYNVNRSEDEPPLNGDFRWSSFTGRVRPGEIIPLYFVAHNSGRRPWNHRCAVVQQVDGGGEILASRCYPLPENFWEEALEDLTPDERQEQILDWLSDARPPVVQPDTSAGQAALFVADFRTPDEAPAGGVVWRLQDENGHHFGRAFRQELAIEARSPGEQPPAEAMVKLVARELFKFYALVSSTVVGELPATRESAFGVIAALQTAMSAWMQGGRQEAGRIVEETLAAINGQKFGLESRGEFRLRTFWQNLPYDQMQAIPFVDMDFGSSTNVNVNGKDYIVKGSLAFLHPAPLINAPDPVICRYKRGNTTITGHTTKVTWNKMFISPQL